MGCRPYSATAKSSHLVIERVQQRADCPLRLLEVSNTTTHPMGAGGGTRAPSHLELLDVPVGLLEFGRQVGRHRTVHLLEPVEDVRVLGRGHVPVPLLHECKTQIHGHADRKVSGALARNLDWRGSCRVPATMYRYIEYVGERSLARELQQACAVEGVAWDETISQRLHQRLPYHTIS